MGTLSNSRPYALQDSQGLTIQDSYIDEAFRGDYLAGTNLIYKGFAAPGAAEGSLEWQIAFCTYDGNGNITSITWPRNTSGFPSKDYLFSWTARASYIYV